MPKTKADASAAAAPRLSPRRVAGRGDKSKSRAPLRPSGLAKQAAAGPSGPSWMTSLDAAVPQLDAPRALRKTRGRRLDSRGAIENPKPVFDGSGACLFFRCEAWRSSRGQGECVRLKATVAPASRLAQASLSLEGSRWRQIKSNAARLTRRSRCSNSTGLAADIRRRLNQRRPAAPVRPARSIPSQASSTVADGRPMGALIGFRCRSRLCVREVVPSEALSPEASPRSAGDVGSSPQGSRLGCEHALVH
ncbi:hypothetical protein MTO96_020619 [Rhipicephalus appendiculatus]